MKTISKRELNQQTARVLADVRDGEPVLVTERGVPRWRIETADVAIDPLARLRAQGRLIPPRKSLPPWPKNWGHERRGRTPADVDALFADMRGDH